MAVADIIHDRGEQPGGLTDAKIFTILQVILAIFAAPLAVFLERGLGQDLLINILLSIIFWLPGVCHGLYIVLKYESRIPHPRFRLQYD